MTEAGRSKRPPASAVFWASVLLFTAFFALLAYRFAAEQAASQATARAVQVRKVIKRRVVRTIVPSPGQNTVTAGPISSSYSAGAEPVVTSAS